MTKVNSIAFSFPFRFPFSFLAVHPLHQLAGLARVVSSSSDSRNLAKFLLWELDDVEGRDASSGSAQVFIKHSFNPFIVAFDLNCFTSFEELNVFSASHSGLLNSILTTE